MNEPIERGLRIAGEEREAESGERLDSRAKDTGRLLGWVAAASRDDVGDAVDAARAAAPGWAGLAPGEREAHLLALADRLAAEGEDRLLDLLIDESGSTITKARGELLQAVQLLRAAAGEARRLYGDTFPADRPHRLSLVVREPLGVVAVITPFNSPVSLFTKLIAFPLAAGNTLVVKPSEHTPLIACAYTDLVHDAGVPPGVFNLLPGTGPACGAPLVAHPGLDGVAFTGSTAAGRKVAALASEHMHRVQLELGGKNPLVVLADMDPDAAAAQAVVGAFSHAGQVCMANTRIIVEAPIAERFTAALVARARALPLGDLRDPTTAYGPLISEVALAKVDAHVRAAISLGGRMLTGGHALPGRRFAPTIIAEVPSTCPIWREEVFGPVVCVATARDAAHALQLANDGDYGLSAGVLTRDLRRGLDLARKIRAGSVHVGTHAYQSDALAPIGGRKLSGVGRVGGKYSTESFTELKWIGVELGEPNLPF